MEHGGDQGGLPVPPPPRRRLITAEDYVLAHGDGNHGPGITGFPLPKNAPEYEGTVWVYNRDRDGTGDDLGNLIKQAIYNIQNKIGNKRREIIKVLPATKRNGKQITSLAIELSNLEGDLATKLVKLHEVVDTDLKKPDYFNKFPALKD